MWENDKKETCKVKWNIILKKCKIKRSLMTEKNIQKYNKIQRL